MTTETPQRRAVVVGLFVAASAAMLAAGVLAIGNINDTFTRKVTVTAVFAQVNGLQAGDNIWFSGLKVGVVKRLAFTGAADVTVAMLLDRDASEHIPRDVLAKIGSDGLIGNKIIVLYGGGDAGADPIADGGVVAVGKTESMEEMLAMAQQNNVNLLAITADLKAMTHRLVAGEGSAGKLLADDALYTDAAATAASLKDVSARAVTLTGDLASFAHALDRPGGLGRDLATDQAIYPSLVASAASLQQTAADAKTLVGGLSDGAGDPNSAVGALLHDDAAGADLRVTLANLATSTALLSEDLEAAQHNFLLRGFFKRRDKAAEKAAAEPAR